MIASSNGNKDDEDEQIRESIKINLCKTKIIPFYYHHRLIIHEYARTHTHTLTPFLLPTKDDVEESSGSEGNK
jgi:hypothetical protein